MELAPPSYSDATRRNHWTLIAPYLRFEDLLRACLVCKAWHKAFGPQLWGNPMRNASSRFEDPWFALRRFENVLLRVARFEVREMTHTLEVPADLDSLHIDIGSRWLYNLLSRLPRLQSLIVRHVSYIDHNSISLLSRELEKNPQQFFQHLRLLDASKCLNIGEQSISNIGKIFPNLVYLDLSDIAGRIIVPSTCLTGTLRLQSFEALQHLKVLKLQNCKLNDSMIRVIASTVKKRIRSLDVRNNLLTNSSLIEILKHCLGKTENIDDEQQNYSNFLADEPPGYQKADASSKQEVQRLDDELFSTLTKGPTGRIALEDDGQPGITQLQLSLSSVSLQTLVACMECPNLQYLDMETGKVAFDSTDYLTPIYSNLEYFRIHHSLVTTLSESMQQFTDFDNVNRSKLSLFTVRELRKELTEKGRTDWIQLIPTLPKLRTFVLTGIPKLSSDKLIVDRLIALLRKCGINKSLATAQAHFEYHSSPTESKTKSRAEETRARALKPLANLVFELVKQPSSQATTPKGWNLPVSTRAVTEDRDSQAVWDIANNDYSFFDHPGYEEEPDARLNISNVTPIESIESDHGKKIDTAEAIVQFRRKTREKYAATLAAGKQYEIVHDYLDATVSLDRTKG